MAERRCYPTRLERATVALPVELSFPENDRQIYQEQRVRQRKKTDEERAENKFAPVDFMVSKDSMLNIQSLRHFPNEISKTTKENQDKQYHVVQPNSVK
ncbi:hypothetical protein WA026_016846 [Henosepilachna vigintioctopunctata]|uniref:Uncharacterized protein n=1 Tax=Henosepilachna vigintioctopunctata TaxID=420089 RepID=A0AAW1U8S7_9CUCU